MQRALDKERATITIHDLPPSLPPFLPPARLPSRPPSLPAARVAPANQTGLHPLGQQLLGIIQGTGLPALAARPLGLLVCKGGKEGGREGAREG